MTMKLLFMGKRRGVDMFIPMLTADNTDHASFVRNMPGVGKPFYLFATLPDGDPSGVIGWADAPVVSSDPAVNQANIDAMLADPPWHVLVY